MRGIPFGRLFGIPLELHVSWLIIFFLLTWSLAAGLFPETIPGLDAVTYWLLGALTAVLFFAGLIAHELGHALTARKLGVETVRITLFVFGGVAQLKGDLKTGRGEALMAAAGPAVSLVLALLFWLLSFVGGPVGAVSIWLARINLILVVFNLLPGFPLDGGRILRGVVWARTRDLARATRIAVTAGLVVSWGMIAFGAVMFFGGNFIGGLWLVILAFFLQSAATAEAGHTIAKTTLKDFPATRTLAQTDWPTLAPETPLSQVAEFVLETGRRAYPVLREDGRFLGLVTLDTVRKVPRDQWPFTRAEQAMLLDIHAFHPHESAIDAVRRMGEHNVHQMPVLTGDRYVGMVSRGQLIALLQLHGADGVVGR